MYRQVITNGSDTGKRSCVYCFHSDKEEPVERTALSENVKVQVPYHPFCKEVIPLTPREACMELQHISKEQYYGRQNDS